MLKHTSIVILVFIRMTLHVDCDISENPSDESCGCATNRKHNDDSPASKYTIEHPEGMKIVSPCELAALYQQQTQDCLSPL